MSLLHDLGIVESYLSYLLLEGEETLRYREHKVSYLTATREAAYKMDSAERRSCVLKLMKEIPVRDKYRGDQIDRLCLRLAELSNPLLICLEDDEWFVEACSVLAILEKLCSHRPLPYSLPWASLISSNLVAWLEGLLSNERFVRMDYRALLREKRVAEGPSGRSYCRTLDLLCSEDVAMEALLEQLATRVHLPEEVTSRRELLNIFVVHLFFAYCHCSEILPMEGEKDPVFGKNPSPIIGYFLEYEGRFTCLARELLSDEERVAALVLVEGGFTEVNVFQIARELVESLETIFAARSPWDTLELASAWQSVGRCSAIVGHYASLAQPPE